jgi:hypothetical protein
MAAAPELIPVASRVLLRSLLIPITALCAYLFVWGCCQAVSAMARAFFGTAEGIVGWVPFAGKVLSHKIEDIEHKIVSIVGGYGHHFENQFFTRWHSLAQMLRQWAYQIEDTAVTVFHVAHAVARLAGELALGNTKGLHAYLHRLEKYINGVIAQRLERIGKIAGHAAPASVARAVRAIAAELDHVITWDIPRLRARSRAIEKSLDRLWHRVRGLDKVVVDTALVGAVAVALGRLGLGWLRCSSVKNLGKRIGCGGFGLLEELFAASLISFAVLDICDFAAAAQTVAEAFVPELMALVDVEDALIGCHGATAAPLLSLPALQLPPNSRGLQLAA